MPMDMRGVYSRRNVAYYKRGDMECPRSMPPNHACAEVLNLNRHLGPNNTMDYAATPGDREVRRPRPRAMKEADRP